jgi:hypothetical protein
MTFFSFWPLTNALAAVFMFICPAAVSGSHEVIVRWYHVGHLEKYSFEADDRRLRAPRCRFNGPRPLIEAI